MSGGGPDPIDRLRGRFNELLDRLLEPEALDGGEEGPPGVWAPEVDVVETDDRFVLHAELPGVRRADLELELSDGRLELSGRRRPPADAVTYHRLERRYGPFRRVFDLGDQVETGTIEASYRRGVLTVTLPKRGARPRQVPIAGGRGR